MVSWTTDTPTDDHAAPAPRRFASVAHMRQHEPYHAMPPELCAILLDYATRHDFAFGPAGTDIQVYRLGSDWHIDVSWHAIERCCRLSGLWMPGRTQLLRDVAGELTMIGSCWTRFDRTSEQWVEVSVAVRYRSEYVRIDDPQTIHVASPPREDWAIAPEFPLDLIAQYRAAAKALGEFVTQHPTKLKLTQSLEIAYVQEQREAAATRG